MELDSYMVLNSTEIAHVIAVNKHVIKRVDSFIHKVQYYKVLIGY